MCSTSATEVYLVIRRGAPVDSARFTWAVGRGWPTTAGTLLNRIHVLGSVGLLANFSAARSARWKRTIDSFQDASGFYRVDVDAPGHQPYHAAGEATASLALLGLQPARLNANFSALAAAGPAAWRAFFDPLALPSTDPAHPCYSKKLGGLNIHSCGPLGGHFRSTATLF